MPIRTLGLEGGGFGGGPTLIGERNECQRGRWAPKEVDCENLTLVGEENETPFIKVNCENPTLVREENETPFIRVEGNPERESSKRTISTSGGIGPLQ